MNLEAIEKADARVKEALPPAKIAATAIEGGGAGKGAAALSGIEGCRSLGTPSLTAAYTPQTVPEGW